MLFEVVVCRKGEAIYRTSVAELDTAQRTAEYLAMKYDEKADSVIVFREGNVPFWLWFDTSKEDWVEADENRLVRLNLQKDKVAGTWTEKET